MNDARKSAGTAVQNKLEELAIELDEVLRNKRELEAQEKALKKQIGDLAATYALPIKDGASEYLNVTALSKALYVQQPEPTVAIADPEGLRRHLGCDTFHKICVIRKVEFLPEAWTLLHDEERVKDDDLTPFVSSSDNAPRIGFRKARPQ